MSTLQEKIEVEISVVEQYWNEMKQDGKSILISSSFQTHSIPMLHILSQFDDNINVHFVDTGFHFPETIVFRDQVVEFLGIECTTISSQISKIDLLDKDNRFLFITNPDYCCELNKVRPLDKICQDYDVWITGVRGDQSSIRSDFDYFGSTSDGVERFHPMINWDSKMINTYISKHELPSHPLEVEGYQSVGCSPCTGKPIYDSRSGRWIGMKKVECGLHLGVK